MSAYADQNHAPSLAVARLELLCQRMLSIIYSCKVQKFLHVTTDVFPLFPYHSDFYADGWIEGNSFYTGGGKLVGHAGVEKTAVLAGFYQLQGGIDLTAAHDDIWGVAVHFKARF